MAASGKAKGLAGTRRALNTKEAAFVGSSIHAHGTMPTAATNGVVQTLQSEGPHAVKTGHLAQAVHATSRAISTMPGDSPRREVARRAVGKMAAAALPIVTGGASPEPGDYSPSL